MLKIALIKIQHDIKPSQRLLAKIKRRINRLLKSAALSRVMPETSISRGLGEIKAISKFDTSSR